MTTAIVSDLHLATTAGTDVARRADVLERLLEALAGADLVVVLGDLLEMRERPATAVLGLAEPFLDALGEATAGGQVMLVPGNHDHELVAPALDSRRLDGRGPLGVEAFFAADQGLARRVAERMPRTEVIIAYPGLWLREDVYATHGHYLDLHLTVPRVECVLASAIDRFAGSPREDGRMTPESYEAALAPLYGFAYSIVQGSSVRAVTRGGSLSRAVWSHAHPGGRRGLKGLAVGRLAIPGAVAALNALGLGPFGPDISAPELRRAGLRAMGQVVAQLGIEAEHVVFGHTHRAGPLDGEVEGWTLEGGTRLTNTGSWIYESVFIGGARPDSPYWPGRMTWIGDEGPPELASVLHDVDFADVHEATDVAE